MAKQGYDWKGYLRLANTILDNKEIDEETRCRVSVSRAYYAAFHKARAYLDVKYNGYFDGGSHEGVYNALMKMKIGSIEDNQKRHSIANDLKKLKLDRNAADYNDRWDRSVIGAQRKCQRAESIILRLESLL